MPLELDHLVLTVPDLGPAVSAFTSRTGVEPVPGGSHAGMGTRNALVALAWRGRRRAYLELLGPDPDQDPVPPERTMLGAGAVWARGPRLHGWAVEAPGELLEDALARARAAGVPVGAPVATERQRADGSVLAWRLAAPFPLGLEGVQPFLIDWQGGAHPSDAGLPWVELQELRAVHPDPQHVTTVLTALGADLEVVEGDRPGLQAVLGTPAGEVVLR